MRVLRLKTRRWMIAVAVVALACATTILINEEVAGRVGEASRSQTGGEEVKPAW
jgi:hypothetical protein